MTDNWIGSGENWDTPGDWSRGLPGASSSVEINSGGDPEVTASFGTVASITILNRGGLAACRAGVLARAILVV
jgi:hypothetical protein